MQGVSGCGFELVHLVGGDEDDIASSDWVLFAFEQDGARAIDDEDFVFVVVAVVRGVTTRFDLDLTEGEVWGAVLAADHDGHGRTFDAGHVDGFAGCFVDIADEHGCPFCLAFDEPSFIAGSGGVCVHSTYSCRMTKATNSPIVECFTLGPFMTNCMLVRPDADSKRAWIADVGFEPEALLDRAEEFEIEAIVLTHCHADHIAGVMEARRRLGPVPIIAPAAEVSWLSDPQANLSASLGQHITAPDPERTVSGGEELDLCGQSWKVLSTPGHSPGSISLYHEPVVIVGDVLFAGSIGRTDFPGSSFELLAQSIREKLYTLPPETRVYPGHGAETNIGHEMASNPYVRPVEAGRP